MKTKILTLSLFSAVLASCGLSITLGEDTNVSGEIRLPETIKSQSAPTTQLAKARAVPGEYLVQLSEGVSAQSISKQGVQIQPLSIGNSTWALVKAGSLSEVRKLQGVAFAQPNYIYMKQEIVTNDPYAVPGSLERQWYLDQDSNGIGADNAFERKREFKNTIKVAVIDDGYTLHQDMGSDRFDLTDPGCNEITGVNCLDAIGKDDIPRYQSAQGEASHGMAVAGVINAETNNGQGMAGVGFNALKVVPIRVFAPNKFTTTAVLANAINTAIAKDVRVINLSLCLQEETSTPGEFRCYDASDPNTDGADPLIDAAILAAVNKNITVVASSGNDGNPWVGYPASNDNVISVGATDENKNRLDVTIEGVRRGSNYGDGLDMVAPGNSILTLNIADNATENSRYGLEVGTSFSAPMVSAAAGLLYSRNPALGQGDVRRILRESGEVPTQSTINNARFLRVDLALAKDPWPYSGRVRLLRSNSVVKDTGWKAFGSGNSGQAFNFTEVPTGNYTLVAEVADRNNLNNLIYKCTSDLNVSGALSRTLNVHTAVTNSKCF